MKRSEKILLSIFAVLFLLIVGGGGLMFAFNHYLAIRAENDSLRVRLADMNLAVAQGADWADRQGWLEENVPHFSSRQEASAKLLEIISSQAEKIGVNIGGKEFLEEARALGPDGLPLEEDLGYFDQAAVKITLVGVQEQGFFAWLHALQQPKSFLGITRLQINPSGTNKTVNCEVEFTQFYHEKAAPKVTKTN